jgi:hypothetical protein
MRRQGDNSSTAEAGRRTAAGQRRNGLGLTQIVPNVCRFVLGTVSGVPQS